MTVTTMGGVPVEPVRPLLVTDATTCSLATLGPDGRGQRPMVSATLNVVDMETNEERVMELALSQETALIFIRALGATMVEIQVNTCDDPACLIHQWRRRHGGNS